MKKSLLALAVLGAFAGAASAQTNVTIYGIADIGLQRTDVSGSDADRWDLASGIKNGSRIGFKGSEDLGGGLSAIFQLENGFDLSDGTLGQGGRLFGRQAWVGLQGGFGAVKFGRQNNPIHNTIDAIDPFGTGLAGNLAQTVNNYDARQSNAINYSLPTNLGGIYGEFSYNLGEATGSSSIGRQFGFNVGYANGPLNVVVAYHDQNVATGTAPALVDAGNSRTAFLGATYDFRVAKLHASLAQEKEETVAGVEDFKSNSYMLGVSAPVGPGTILASFQHQNDKSPVAADREDRDVIAIGYLYNISKRTNIYTSFGQVKDEPEGAADEKTRVFNVGLQHRF